MGDLRRFARALIRAVRDVEFERDGGVTELYFDADVIISAIRGLEDVSFHSPTERRNASRRLLVRSLLVGGNLGCVRVLWPHALELLSFLRRNNATFSSGAPGDGAIDLLSEYLKHENVTTTLEHLRSFRDVDFRNPNIVSQFVAQFQQVAANVLIAVELGLTSKQERLGQLVSRKVISFEPKHPNYDSLLSSPIVFQVARDLSKHHQGEDKSVNDLSDATALAELIDRLGLTADPRRLPRFHTGSRRLVAIFEKHPLGRDLLRDPARAGASQRSTILRTSEYLIVRSQFQALAFHCSEPVSSASDEQEWEDLRLIADQLERLTMGNSWDESIGTTRHKGRSLRDVVEELRAVALLDRTLLVPGGARLDRLKDRLEQWQDVWQRAEYSSTSKSAERAVVQFRQELEERLGSAENFHKLFKLVKKRTLEIVAELGGPPNARDVQRIDIMADLGAVRWGIEISTEETSWIEDTILELLHKTNEVAPYVMLVRSMQRVTVDNTAYVLRLAIVLWFLGLFRDVSWVIEAGWPRIATAPFGIRAMYAASRFRDGREQGLRTVQDLALTLYEEAFENEDGQKLLTASYVLFYSAFRDAGQHGHDRATRTANSSRLALAQQAALEATRQLPNNDLAYRFAVNSYVYMVAVSGTDSSEAALLRDELTAFRAHPDQWNYRYADTLAYYTLVATKEQFRRVIEDTTGGNRRDAAAALLNDYRVVRDMLDEVKPYYGDPEISAHLISISQKIITLSKIAEDQKLSGSGPSDLG